MKKTTNINIRIEPPLVEDIKKFLENQKDDRGSINSFSEGLTNFLLMNLF